AHLSRSFLILPTIAGCGRREGRMQYAPTAALPQGAEARMLDAGLRPPITRAVPVRHPTTLLAHRSPWQQDLLLQQESVALRLPPLHSSVQQPCHRRTFVLGSQPLEPCRPLRAPPCPQVGQPQPRQGPARSPLPARNRLSTPRALGPPAQRRSGR